MVTGSFRTRHTNTNKCWFVPIAKRLSQLVAYRLLPQVLDILSALKGEDSPKGILRLGVSSGLKDAFAWSAEGCRPVVTKGVLSSA